MRMRDWSSDVCSSDRKAGSGISAVAGGSAARTLCLLIYPSVKPVMTVSTITAAIPPHAKRQPLAATVKDGITSNTAMNSTRGGMTQGTSAHPLLPHHQTALLTGTQTTAQVNSTEKQR